MTEQQLARHQKWLRLKYGDIDGEDIFQQACVFAIQEYGIEKTNQNLFGLLCRWAARELFKHRSHEVPFSCLRQENNDQTDEVVFDPEDPEWQKEYDAIENMEEVEKLYGKWLLSALLNAATEPKPAKEKEKEEQLEFVFRREKMEKMQREDIETYRRIYQDAGMVTIPLVYNSKIPVKGLLLNGVYDGHNVNGNYEFQNIGIVTGRSGIVVFDCDTIESVEFFMNLQSYIETARVKTRRGMHFYYRVPNAEKIPIQKFVWETKNISIDLKAGRSYVVAPPSIVDGHRYIWNPDDWSWAPPITEISEQDFLAIVKELKEFCSFFEQK